MEYMISSDGIKVFYNVKGEGLPIVFIHGFSENHTSFRIQERVLSKKYKVITYDLRGHGRSDRINRDINLERYALDLRELINFLELEDVNLVGWSMGATLIFEYINIFGLDKLSKICIIDKSPKSINDSGWRLGLYHGNYTIEDGLRDLDLIKSDWLGYGERFIRNMAPYLNEKEFQIAMDRIRLNSPDIMYSIWKSMMEKDYRSTLRKITIPTLILFGEKGTLYSIDVGKYLRDNIVNSNLVIFKDCGHLLVLENPIKFNNLLKEFI